MFNNDVLITNLCDTNNFVTSNKRSKETSENAFELGELTTKPRRGEEIAKITPLPISEPELNDDGNTAQISEAVSRQVRFNGLPPLNPNDLRNIEHKLGTAKAQKGILKVKDGQNGELFVATPNNETLTQAMDPDFKMGSSKRRRSADNVLRASSADGPRRKHHASGQFNEYLPSRKMSSKRKDGGTAKKRSSSISNSPSAESLEFLKSTLSNEVRSSSSLQELQKIESTPQTSKKREEHRCSRAWRENR